MTMEPMMRTCPRCKGSGSDPRPDGNGRPCLVCRGTGRWHRANDVITVTVMASSDAPRQSFSCGYSMTTTYEDEEQPR